MTKPAVLESADLSSDPTPANQTAGRTMTGDPAVSLCTTAIIPAKALALTKTRLAPRLSDKERMHISLHMLLHTIRVTRNALERIVVVSGDSALLRVVETEGAVPLVEQGTSLNAALLQAAASADSGGAGAVLVLPSDLPLLTTDDVRTITGFAAKCPAIAVAPSWRDGGTNALLLRPPSIHIFAFGPNSFSRHCTAARERGIEPHIFWSDTLAFDLDTPADWDDLCARTGAHSFEELISLIKSSPSMRSGAHASLDNSRRAS